MDDPSTSAAALKAEIARLTGVINSHKTTTTSYHASRPRSNVYVNPNYNPPTKAKAFAQPAIPPPRPQPTDPSEKRDVVIAGVAFESSGRSLVRKDLAVSKPKPPLPKASLVRTNAGTLVHANRTYKPKSFRGRPKGRNMTLNNARRPYQPGSRKRKYVDKPCPRFTTTGSCNRGLTCPYNHDPSKIAICWPFLQGNCTHTNATCPLSHDPTPERTPLCVHFANAGRCNRENCPFPHVRVGSREGVCRDFAVLGYCEKGLDCEHQHVRECPDFAEKGECNTKGCKLPHVIRANRNRPKASASTSSSGTNTSVYTDSNPSVSSAGANVTLDFTSTPAITAEDGQLGDEFISLTFQESESENEDDDDEDDEGSDEADEDEDEGSPKESM